MDRRVFLVRASGTGGRPQRGITRILRISENGISLSGALSSPNYGPMVYSFERIFRVLPSPTDSNELTIDIVGSFSKGDETIRLSCESRTALLTALLDKLDDVNGIGTDYFIKKHSHQHGGLIDTILRVRSASIVKMMNVGVRQERRKANPAKKVDFQDIVKMEMLSDDEHVLLLYFKSRVMRLSMKDSSLFLQAIQRNMKSYLHMDLEIGRIPTPTMIENVSAYLRQVGKSPVLYEFPVLKCLDANKQVRERVVSLTNEHFIERSHDEVIGVHRLDDVMGLIVSGRSSNEVILEFRFWRPTQYFVEDIDSFVASMATLMYTGKYPHFSIHLEPFLPETFPDRPHFVYQNECEAFYINKFMASFNSYQDPNVLCEVLKEYACNIHVGDSQCNDIRVVKAVDDVLQRCIRTGHQYMHCATLCCIVLQRLFASRSLFEAVKTAPEIFTTLLQCIQSQNGVLAYLASVAMRSSLKFAVDAGPVDNYSLKLESMNKMALLNVDNMQQLVAVLHNHALAKNSVLQISGLLEVIIMSISSEYVENESIKTWLKALEASVLAAAKIICDIFRCHSPVIFQRNSILLKYLLTKTAPEVRHHLQKLCVSRCVILVHLKNAIFSKKDEIWTLSASLVYLMIGGNSESRKLFESLFPKGVVLLYESKALDTFSSEMVSHEKSIPVWMETLEILREETLTTPLLVWNDWTRMELQKFLEGELERYYTATTVNHDLSYDSADVEIVYTSASEGEGSMIGGVHLELLPEQSPLLSTSNSALWQIKDPLSLFQSVFQSMVLGFTPFFGHNNLPEVDMRLAAHALTWIYERHSENVALSLASLNVIEIIVGMLREVIESEHQVFVFKLVVFLLVVTDSGGRNNVLRFVHAGGMTVLVPLVVLSLAKCCKDKYLFECDAWETKGIKSQGAIETVNFVGYNGKAKLIRVPAGRAREVLGKALQDGSLDAKQAIQWQDGEVPYKVQLGLALDLLETILRLSGGDSSVEIFPASAACSSLSREEVLCHLVQILLRAKTPVFGRILEIVSYVVRANRDAMKRLYKLGVFEITLWKLLAGDLVDSEKIMIITFLRQCHLSQESVLQGEEDAQTEEHSPWHDSILHLYLPQGLILKLMSEDDSSFKMLLDSENDAPEVIWNLEMRQRLLEYLTDELESYVKSRASDSLALYIHTPKPPLEYPELAGIVFTAPFYLQNLLDFDRFPNYQMIDPVGFFNSLMQDLRKCAAALHDKAGSAASSSFLWRKEIHRIHILLQSLAYLLERCTVSPLPNDLESVVISLATPALRTCLAQKDDSPHVTIDIIQQTSRILRRFCAGSLRDMEVPQASLNFSLSVFSLGTNLKADTAFPESVYNSTLEPAIAGALLVLEPVCSTRAGRESLQDDSRWRKGLWWALCSAAGDAAATPPRGPCTTSFAALSCLKYFVEDDQCCERIIKQGLYLPLLLLAIPPIDSTLKANDSKSAMLYSAADVLRSLVHELHKIGQRSAVTRQQGVSDMLSRLIPHPLLQCLEETDGPEKFISLAVSDIILPMSIWTNDVRAELWLRICKRLELYNMTVSAGNSIPMEHELEWLESFQYECLKDEFIVGGLFVRGLCNGYIENSSLPEDQSYFDAIQDYLELHHNSVTDAENCDGQNGIGQEAAGRYLSVLSALRICLSYAIRAGREDLIERFKPSVLSMLVFAGTVLKDIQIELALIVEILSRHQSGELVLQSVMMKALTVQLWKATGTKGSEQVLVSTMEAIFLLTESMPATISATNCFASSGLLLPLLALFCKVELPILCGTAEREVIKLEPIPLSCQLLAAQIIGQLLLAASGRTSRPKLLKDLANAKSFSNVSVRGIVTHHDSIGEETDMYKLLGIIERTSENKGEEPIVIKTLLLLLPIELLSTIARDPSEACDMYDGHFQSPRLVWDEDTRLRVKSTIRKEAADIQKVAANEGLGSIPSWFLKEQHPVFLRWVLITIFDNERAPLYKDDEVEGYAPEMYIGGFYIDQFLRNPEFDFGTAIEERFLHEVRKAIIVGAPTDGISAAAFGFNDKRRLLLALLLLFKLRPAVLSRHSNFDICLPVSDFISSVHNTEQQGLTQVAMLLLHCIATHSDVADCMSSEELICTLASLLELKVPQPDVGFAGTDPRLCSLLLLLRLLRLSCKAVELALQLDLVPKLVKLIKANDDPPEGVTGSPDIIRQRATECLAVMFADKRKGQEVSKLLDKIMPKGIQENEEWKVALADIRDELVDSKTLNHFLQHRYPSTCWVLDLPDHSKENGKKFSDLKTVVEATVTFPKAKLSDFDDESERNFKHNIAAAAGVDMMDVNVLSKRPGSVVIDFEVIFPKYEGKEKKDYYGTMIDMRIQTFKINLINKIKDIFGKSIVKKMGSPFVNGLSIRKLQNLYVNNVSNSWGPLGSEQIPTTLQMFHIASSQFSSMPFVNASENIVYLQGTWATEQLSCISNRNIEKQPSFLLHPYPRIKRHVAPEAIAPDIVQARSEYLVPYASLPISLQSSKSSDIPIVVTLKAFSLTEASVSNEMNSEFASAVSSHVKFDLNRSLASRQATKSASFNSSVILFHSLPSDTFVALVRSPCSCIKANCNEQGLMHLLPQAEEAKFSKFIILPPPQGTAAVGLAFHQQHHNAPLNSSLGSRSSSWLSTAALPPLPSLPSPRIAVVVLPFPPLPSSAPRTMVTMPPSLSLSPLPPSPTAKTAPTLLPVPRFTMSELTPSKRLQDAFVPQLSENPAVPFPAPNTLLFEVAAPALVPLIFSTGGIKRKCADGKLQLMLDDGDASETNKEMGRMNFCEAFDKDEEELCLNGEKLSKNSTEASDLNYLKIILT